MNSARNPAPEVAQWRLLHSLDDSQIKWPIRMHLKEAVDILESWYRADSRVDMLPSACHGRRWRRAMQVAAVLRQWTLERDLPTAVVGFRERPGIITLGWWLAEAGLGGVSWEEFKWTEATFAALQAAINRLAMAPVVILPGDRAPGGP